MNGSRSVFKLRKLLRCDIKCRKKLDFGGCVLYLCYREVRLHLSLTDEKTIFLIYSAFFDILLQQKVGQAGLSETHVYGVFIKKLPEAKWEASGRLIVVWHLLCHYYLVSLWLVIGRMTWHCICE